MQSLYLSVKFSLWSIYINQFQLSIFISCLRIDWKALIRTPGWRWRYKRFLSFGGTVSVENVSFACSELLMLGGQIPFLLKYASLRYWTSAYCLLECLVSESSRLPRPEIGRMDHASAACSSRLNDSSSRRWRHRPSCWPPVLAVVSELNFDSHRLHAAGSLKTLPESNSHRSAAAVVAVADLQRGLPARSVFTQDVDSRFVGRHRSLVFSLVTGLIRAEQDFTGKTATSEKKVLPPFRKCS
jgi:hypothetical protein